MPKGNVRDPRPTNRNIGHDLRSGRHGYADDLMDPTDTGPQDPHGVATNSGPNVPDRGKRWRQQSAPEYEGEVTVAPMGPPEPLPGDPEADWMHLQKKSDIGRRPNIRNRSDLTVNTGSHLGHGFSSTRTRKHKQ